MSYFDGIKVGDRVWSIEYGWGFVKELKNTCYPIVVQFDSEDHQQFTMNGKFFTNSPNQSLFWDEVKITPPPRPKVKEKKSETKWTSICVETGKAVDFLYGSVVCAERAVKGSCYSFIHVPVVIEWEE